MTATTEVAVGTIFVNSWGYDQTNVDFYTVVGVTPSGKSVRMVPVPSLRDDDCHVVPDPKGAGADATPVTKRLRMPDETGCSRPLVVWNSFSNAYVWDGESEYATPFGAGH